MIRLVIDTDPGVDDAHAILLALAHPEVQVEAITTVNGNCSLKNATINACKILDAVGKNIPVYAGCETPIIEKCRPADYVHGTDGLSDCGLPDPVHQPEKEHAVSALVRLANETPGELTLVALGPLSNLALALRIDPQLPQKYKKLVVMGGAIYGRGNTTPTVEFNTGSDPEAAKIVYEAWKGCINVSWETTLEHGFSVEQVNELMQIQSPRADFYRKISSKTYSFLTQVYGERRLYIADLLAIAVAAEPEIVQVAEERYLTVELNGQNTRGQMVVDWNRVLDQETNVKMVLKMDRTRLWEMVRLAIQ